jgi:hypothetical protein
MGKKTNTYLYKTRIYTKHVSIQTRIYTNTYLYKHVSIQTRIYTNTYLYKTLQTTKCLATHTPLKTGVNICAPKGLAVPGPLVAPVVLLLLQTP